MRNREKDFRKRFVVKKLLKKTSKTGLFPIIILIMEDFNTPLPNYYLYKLFIYLDSTFIGDPFGLIYSLNTYCRYNLVKKVEQMTTWSRSYKSYNSVNTDLVFYGVFPFNWPTFLATKV